MQEKLNSCCIFGGSRMKKEFSLSTGKAMINFTAKYCDTAEALFNSYGFKRVLQAYMEKIKKRETNVYKYIEVL